MRKIKAHPKSQMTKGMAQLSSDWRPQAAFYMNLIKPDWNQILRFIDEEKENARATLIITFKADEQSYAETQLKIQNEIEWQIKTEGNIKVQILINKSKLMEFQELIVLTLNDAYCPVYIKGNEIKNTRVFKDLMMLNEFYV